MLCLLAATAQAEESNCLFDMTKAYETALTAGDIDGIMELYLDSVEILAIESGGQVRRGREGIRAMYAEALSEADWTEADFELIRTDLGKKEGFCFFRFTARGASKPGPDGLILSVQGTWIVRNTKAGWRIVHEHMSPLDAVPRLRTIKPEPEPPE